MRFIIEITPGDHTTSRDLRMQSPAIRAALNLAVDDIANNVYPEFTFSDVTVEELPEVPRGFQIGNGNTQVNSF